MKATRLNARHARSLNIVMPCKAHDGMDAQEIFHNQDNFTIADNKKVITAYSTRVTEDPRHTHQCNLYKVNIFVERATASCNFYQLSREKRQGEKRRRALEESEEGSRS